MKLLFFVEAGICLMVIALTGCAAKSENSGEIHIAEVAETTVQEQYVEPIIPARLPESAVQDPEDSRKVAKGVYLEKKKIGGLTQAGLEDRLYAIAAKTDIAVVQAKYDKKTWKISKEKAGRDLDIENIEKAALSARPGQKISYSYKKVKPTITTAQLKDKIKMIAQYSTPLLDRSRPRVRNIRLAAKKLNYKIIQPGEEFSFNQTTGSTSRKAGYENATIIINTPEGPKRTKAPGGGVCQLSTTIYNAVLKCSLNVTERHAHSDDVHYVPKGKDATVSYKGADFKFVNNREHPIMIKVYVGKKAVRVVMLENSDSLPNGTG